MVSVEKSDVILNVFLPIGKGSFFFHCFQDFFFVFSFQMSNYDMSWCGFSLVFNVWDSFSFLNL